MRDADATLINRADDADIPAITAGALLRDRPLLVLAPHPDDESLGCGALLTKGFARPGAHVVVLTDGAASHPGSQAVSPSQLAAIRRGETEDAVGHLGGSARDITFLAAPDSGLEASAEMVARVLDLALTGGYGLLAAPSPLDPHCDHEAAAAIGAAVARRVPGLRVVFYPVWSRWHGGGRAPVPPGTVARRLPVGTRAVAKARAIAAHRSQAGLVVPDDPAGFEMPQGFADFFATRDELYFLDPKDVTP